MEESKVLEGLERLGGQAEGLTTKVDGVEATVAELKELDTERKAEIEAVRAEALKKRAAKSGERYGSGRYRDFTTGNIAGILGILNQREVTGQVKLDGVERVAEGIGY